MSNNLDHQSKEGVVSDSEYTTTRPIVSNVTDDGSSDSDNSDANEHDIVSNITDDGSDSHKQNDGDSKLSEHNDNDKDNTINNINDINDSNDDANGNEMEDTEVKQENVNANNAVINGADNQQPQPQPQPQNNNNNNNPIPGPTGVWDFFLGIGIVLVVIVAIIVAKASLHSHTNTPKRAPADTVLMCPKCDSRDIDGTCLRYVPFSASEYRINAQKETSNWHGTQYSWKTEEEYVSVTTESEDSHLLEIYHFESEGREDIQLIMTADSTDAKTGKDIAIMQTCNMTLVIYNAPYFGIDLGTTYSCIAYQEPQISNNNRRPATIVKHFDEHHKQQYCIPTMVYFGKNNKMKIGYKAKQMLNRDPSNVIYDQKRIIGRRSNDAQIELFKENHPFMKISTDKEYPKIVIPNRSNIEISPEQALSIVLIELVQIASKQFGVPYVTDVVVTVPAMFHDAQRKAVRSSCQIAGLNLQKLVVEPSAGSIAQIYYDGMHGDDSAMHFMTLDIGGGTTDVSLLQCNGLDCIVTGVGGNTSLGGRDFDFIIENMIKEKVMAIDGEYAYADLGDNEKRKIDMKIRSDAEMVKIRLSESEVSELYFSELNNVRISITKNEFETRKETLDLIANIIDLAKSAAINANHANTHKQKQLSNVRAVLMIGGTVKIPIIQEKLNEEFGAKMKHLSNVKKDTKIIFPNEDPQLMVVKGSAVIGGSLSSSNGGNGRRRDANGESINVLRDDDLPKPHVNDVLPMALGFEICTMDKNRIGEYKCLVMDKLIEKNSMYGTKGSEIYCQKNREETTANLRLYEGDSENVTGNFYLGELKVFDVPKRAVYDPCDNIMVELSIDMNGMVNITAKVKGNGNVYSKLVPIHCDEISLEFAEIQKLRKQVLSWFPVNVRRNVLNAVESN